MAEKLRHSDNQVIFVVYFSERYRNIQERFDSLERIQFRLG